MSFGSISSEPPRCLICRAISSTLCVVLICREKPWPLMRSHPFAPSSWLRMMRTSPADTATPRSVPSRSILRSALKPTTSTYHVTLFCKSFTVSDAWRTFPISGSGVELMSPPRKGMSASVERERDLRRIARTCCLRRVPRSQWARVELNYRPHAYQSNTAVAPWRRPLILQVLTRTAPCLVTASDVRGDSVFDTVFRSAGFGDRRQSRTRQEELAAIGWTVDHL